MTKEEILAMEPGSKLDVLILDILGDSHYDSDGLKLYYNFADPESIPDGGRTTPASVSTSIFYAWQVVEKMRDSFGFFFELQLVTRWSELQIWLATFHQESKFETGAEEQAKGHSAPEAISKAAAIAMLKEAK